MFMFSIPSAIKWNPEMETQQCWKHVYVCLCVCVWTKPLKERSIQILTKNKHGCHIGEYTPNRGMRSYIHVSVFVLVSTAKEGRKRRSGIKQTFASITGPADAILMHSAWLHIPIPIHAWMNARTLIQLNTQNVDLKKVHSFAYLHARVRLYACICVCVRCTTHNDVNCIECIWNTWDRIRG